MSDLGAAILSTLRGPLGLDAWVHDGHTQEAAWQWVETLDDPPILQVNGKPGGRPARRQCSPRTVAHRYCETCGTRMRMAAKEGPKHYALRRFCGHDCANASPAVRASRGTHQHTVRGEPSPHGLRAAQRDRTEGKCLFCATALPPRVSKPREICGAPACVRARDRAYKLDQRRAVA